MGGGRFVETETKRKGREEKRNSVLLARRGLGTEVKTISHFPDSLLREEDGGKESSGKGVPL